MHSVSETARSVADLASVYGHAGPFATVFLDATRTSEAGAREVDLRWADVRKSLQSQGADEATLAALDRAIAGDASTSGRHGLVAISAAGALCFAATVPDPPAQSTGRLAPLPHLLPYVAQQATRLPHLVVVTDRSGADILTVDAAGHRETVSGSATYPLHRTATADWSEKHFQARVENNWESNAQDVARAVTEYVAASAASLVVIAGDVRARHLVADALGNRPGVTVRVVDAGGRAPDASEEALEDAVRAEVLREVWRRRHEVLGHLRDNLGRAEYAVAGIDAVVQALRMSQVDTVVVSDDPSSTLVSWIGPRATDFGLDDSEAAAFGVSDFTHDRFDAALVRAAVGTGAGLLVTPGAHDYLPDGIGALLRYETA